MSLTYPAPPSPLALVPGGCGGYAAGALGGSCAPALRFGVAGGKLAVALGEHHHQLGPIIGRQVRNRLGELQSALLRDDGYLPGLRRPVSALCARARLGASAGEAAPLRDGTDRQVGDDPHAWTCPEGGQATYSFDEPVRLQEVALVLDSGMDQLIASVFQEGFHSLTRLPPVTPRDFRLEVLQEGRWVLAHRAADNRRRHVRLPVGVECAAVRFTLERTWGSPRSRVYGFYVE